MIRKIVYYMSKIEQKRNQISLKFRDALNVIMFKPDLFQWACCEFIICTRAHYTSLSFLEIWLIIVSLITDTESYKAFGKREFV